MFRHHSPSPSPPRPQTPRPPGGQAGEAAAAGRVETGGAALWEILNYTDSRGDGEEHAETGKEGYFDWAIA